MEFIERDLVMLPTNEKAILGLNSIHNHLFLANDMAEIPTQKYQHLYVLSDEKPKAGEWAIYQNKIHMCVEDILGDEFKKIIATTDKSLSKSNDRIYPELPDPFIQYFVEEFNKGNLITKIKVGYTNICPITKELINITIKVNPDNTIDIMIPNNKITLKDLMVTNPEIREEVAHLLEKKHCMSDEEFKTKYSLVGLWPFNWNKFIEENL